MYMDVIGLRVHEDEGDEKTPRTSKSLKPSVFDESAAAVVGRRDDPYYSDHTIHL